MTSIAPVPNTPRRPVTDTYHGVSVTEEYRWLENANDQEVRDWTAAQNKRTRAYLDSIAQRPAIHARLTELLSAGSPHYYALTQRAGTLFALKRQPPRQQPLLVTLASADDLSSERVVLDPNERNPNGTTAMDWYVPSLDGRLVAVSLSENGSEVGTLHIFDALTGAELDDHIPRVQYPTGGGSVAWNADGSGVYYTRYPAPGERPTEDLPFYQQVYFHRLGTAVQDDQYVIGEDFPRIAEIELETSDDGRYLLAVVANGDGGEFAHYLRDGDGPWQQITQFADEVSGVAFGDDGLYLLSRKGAPRGQVLRLALDARNLEQATVVVRESDAAIRSFTPAGTRLYVNDLLGGPSQLRACDLATGEQATIPIEPVSAVWQMVKLEGDAILYQSSSFLTPPAWYRFEPDDEEPEMTALRVTAPADFEDSEVVRTVAPSTDGTEVPLNIIRRKGTPLDGSAPTILYAYGGYGISLSPYFGITMRLWLDAGGVYVIANLRGGGEFGDDWHKAGSLTNKQNVFDDFAACARYLIEAAYTRPERLAIEGRSNGGLLMGAALTQHPELYRAVLAWVGIYDMLRVELDPNGAFNVTEFGTVANEAQFHALHAYSPYHNVRDGETYPAVLFITGENDGRVNPAHSLKMTARLQAATGSDRPVLLRTSASSGHGMGTSLSERIDENADAFAFLFDQLGVRYVQ